MDSTSDTSLWYYFKKGDINAFKALFNKYYPLLHTYGIKLTGDEHLTSDCLQSFFIYLYEKRDRSSDVQHLKSYLFISFKRRLIKQLEKQFLRSNYAELNPFEKEIVFSQQEISEKQEIQFLCTQTLHELLNGLPKREREVVYFKYYCDMNTAEISEVMEIKAQSVLNLLQKAMIKLRKHSENKLIAKILKKS